MDLPYHLKLGVRQEPQQSFSGCSQSLTCAPGLPKPEMRPSVDPTQIGALTLHCSSFTKKLGWNCVIFTPKEDTTHHRTTHVPMSVTDEWLHQNILAMHKAAVPVQQRKKGVWGDSEGFCLNHNTAFQIP